MIIYIWEITKFGCKRKKNVFTKIIFIFYEDCLSNKCILNKWNGSIWLRIGTGGGLLWMRSWTFGFHKIRGISWEAEKFLAFRKDSAPCNWLVSYEDIYWPC